MNRRKFITGALALLPVSAAALMPKESEPETDYKHAYFRLEEKILDMKRKIDIEDEKRRKILEEARDDTVRIIQKFSQIHST